MSAIDFNMLAGATGPTTTPLGLVHHQTRLDIFIIKAFQLLSNGTIIDSNGFNSVAPSPQPVATLIKNASIDGAATVDDNGSNSTHVSPKQLEVARPANGASAPTPGSVKAETGSDTGSPQVFSSRPQYIAVFQKVAAVYNATLSSPNGPIDEKSTSPKSAIELFQRLHQIIREMSLSYEASPYCGYFAKLSDNMWQIRPDADLQDDQLWQFVTNSILAVYNAETGQLIAPQNARGKKNNNNNNNTYPQALSTNSSPNNSGASVDGPTGTTSSTTETTPTSLSSAGGATVGASSTAAGKKTSANNTQQGPKKVVKKKYNRKKNAATKRELAAAAAAASAINPQLPRHSTSGIPEFTLGQGQGDDGNDNSNSNTLGAGQDSNDQQLPSMSLNMDPSLPQILQRRLQNISQESGSRALSGYYTQPTSPGSDVNSFEFGLSANDFDTNDSNIVFNSANPNNPVDSMSSVATNGTQPITANPNVLNPALWKRRSMGALVGTTMEEPDSVEELLQFSNNFRGKQFPVQPQQQQSQRNGMDILDQPSQNALAGEDGAITAIDDNIQTSNIQGNQEVMMVESVSKLLNQSYGSLLDEKDMRISQLEKELEMQRNETQWLRKMLIEDLGCVRSLLNNTRG